MAFPTTGVLDNFTYSNGALATVSGGVWASPGADFNVSSGTIFPISGGGAIATYAAGGNISNAEAFITVTTLPGSGQAAGVAWLDTSGNGYGVTYVHGVPGSLTVFEIATFVGTPLGAAASVTLSVNDQIGMQISGATTIDAYTATGGVWTLHLSRSDGTYTTARRIGLSATGTSVGMDAFGGGVTVGGSPVGSLLGGKLVGGGILAGRLVR